MPKVQFLKHVVVQPAVHPVFTGNAFCATGMLRIGVSFRKLMCDMFKCYALLNNYKYWGGACALSALHK